VRPRPCNACGLARTRWRWELGGRGEVGGRGSERMDGEKNTQNNVYFYLSYMYRTNYLLKDF
jgi:hypothetical protein